MDNIMLVARRNRAEKMAMDLFEDSSFAMLNGMLDEAKRCRRMAYQFQKMVDELDSQLKANNYYFNKEK